MNLKRIYIINKFYINSSTIYAKKILKISYWIKWKVKKMRGGAGIWTQDFQHAKQTLYHWVTPPFAISYVKKRIASKFKQKNFFFILFKILIINLQLLNFKYILFILSAIIQFILDAPSLCAFWRWMTFSYIKLQYCRLFSIINKSKHLDVFFSNVFYTLIIIIKQELHLRWGTYQAIYSSIKRAST